MRRGSRRSVHGWDSGVYTEEGSKQHEAREIESVQLTFLLECITRFLTLALSLSPRAPGKRIDRAACRRRAKKLYNVLRASISYKDGGIERSDSFVGDQSQ